MNTAVKVTAESGAKEGQVKGRIVIPNTGNPEYGYVRVQSTSVVHKKGFLNDENRSALIRGKMTTLLDQNYTEGQILPGKIVVVESTKCPYPGAQAKINPSTGEVIKFQGADVYRESYYTEDLTEKDTLLKEQVAVSSVVSGGHA